jgi:hypothetical protein
MDAGARNTVKSDVALWVGNFKQGKNPKTQMKLFPGRHTSLNRIFERSAARLSPANSGSRRPVTIQMSEEA